MSWLRDWWRGWSDEDLRSYREKVGKGLPQPGSMTPLTMRELRAGTQNYSETEHCSINMPAREGGDA